MVHMTHYPTRPNIYDLWKDTMITKYLGLSKVWQYFDNVWHNSAAMEIVAEVMNMIDHMELQNGKLTRYSISATYQICFMAWNMALKSTVLGLPDLVISEVLLTQAKFLEPFGYCTVINSASIFH